MTLARDLRHEVGVTAAAARHFQVSADSINAMAGARALPGPVRVEGRDLCREALEEAADGRNYICWLILHMTYSGHRNASDAMVHLGYALGAFCYAFHELERAQKLLR